MSGCLDNLPAWLAVFLWVGCIVLGLLLAIGVAVVLYLISDWRETREWNRNLERQNVRNQPAPRSGT